jgi:hypothetical protein
MAVVWARINTLLLLLVLLALLAVLGVFATSVRGGPLDPPAAPGPTDGVRAPGTPISSLPFTITQPGSYYLTRNLSVASGNGITINADGVTLDLMGFTLSGPGSNTGSYGITSDGVTTRRNNTIRNGVLRGWGIGVATPNFIRSTYEDLRVTDNVWGLNIGSGSDVRHVMSAYNTIGLAIAQRDDAWGGSVSDSNFIRNSVYGIFVSANNIWVHGNVIDSNGSIGVAIATGGSWNEVTDNRIVGNGGGLSPVGGVEIGTSATGNLIARNVIAGNVPNAVQDFGMASRIGTFVGDASITATNPWSNVVY